MRLLTKVTVTLNKGYGSTLELKDIEKINIVKSIDMSKNKLNITLKNRLGRYINSSGKVIFQEDDVVKVYIKWQYSSDQDITEDDLIMVANVKQMHVRLNNNSRAIELVCEDKISTFFKRVWVKNYTSAEGLTAPQIIQNIIRNVTSNPVEKFAYDDDGNLVLNGKYEVDARIGDGTEPNPAFIQNKRSDGTDFPIVAIAKVYKPVYEWISDLSTPNYTGDNRTYRWYIDEKNRFHWFYPRDNLNTELTVDITATDTTIPVTSTEGFPASGIIFIENEEIFYYGKTSTSFLNCVRGYNNTLPLAHSNNTPITSAYTIYEGETHHNNYELFSVDLRYETREIVNHVIFNAGQDLENVNITGHYFHKGSRAPLNTKFYPMTHIALELKNAEVSVGNITINSDGTVNYPSTYPITTSWGVTVNSDSEYNDEFRKRALELATNQAILICKNRGLPSWKGKIKVRGHRFIPGELVLLKFPFLGVYNEPLRITKVTHNISKTYWTTELDLEKDENKQVS